jgi:hypothetical protein
MRKPRGWDVLLLLHKNMLVANPHFLAELGPALDQADVVSFAGATRWEPAGMAP